MAGLGIVDGIPSNTNSNFVTGRTCKIRNFRNTSKWYNKSKVIGATSHTSSNNQY